ncbi:MAG: hypothetical protein LBQ77_03725 [Treponema sp.]|jgi:hypothetical protein|nr:hypothetical protein [Treponema sp.]
MIKVHSASITIVLDVLSKRTVHDYGSDKLVGFHVSIHYYIQLPLGQAQWIVNSYTG